MRQRERVTTQDKILQDAVVQLHCGAEGPRVTQGAVRAVHRGQRGIPSPVAARLAEHAPRIGLTTRELEVLRFVADGMSNAEVAVRIGRTEGTVKVHVKNILQKLGVHDRTEAVTTALRRGFIRLDELRTRG